MNSISYYTFENFLYTEIYEYLSWKSANSFKIVVKSTNASRKWEALLKIEILPNDSITHTHTYTIQFI